MRGNSRSSLHDLIRNSTYTCTAKEHSSRRRQNIHQGQIPIKSGIPEMEKMLLEKLELWRRTEEKARREIRRGANREAA